MASPLIIHAHHRWCFLLLISFVLVNASLPTSPSNNNVTCSSVRSAYRARGLPDRDVPQSNLPIPAGKSKSFAHQFCVCNLEYPVGYDWWVDPFVFLFASNDKNWHFDARVFTYVVVSIVQTSPMLNASYQSHHHHFHYIIMWSRAYRECKATKKETGSWKQN